MLCQKVLQGSTLLCAAFWSKVQCVGKYAVGGGISARHLCLVLSPGFATFSLAFSIAAALVLEIKPTLLPPRIAEMPENPSRESLQKRVSCKKRHFAVKSEYEK